MGLEKNEEINVKISDTYVINDRRFFIPFLILFSILFLFILYIFGYNMEINNMKEVYIDYIEVLSYDLNSNIIDIAIVPNSVQKYCALDNGEELEYINLENGKCYLSVPFNKQYVYFKNSYGFISRKLEVNNYVVDLILKDKYYVPLGKEINLEENLIKVGNPNVVWLSSGETLVLNNNRFVSSTSTRMKLVAMNNNIEVAETEIVVTDTIVDYPKNFNSSKDFLTCGVFSDDEAKLLDEILEYRINEAGYETRAGAVAAARFLTLEFPYRISYYWENGRLNNTGTHYVDGEGRYYHKGLYLSESKYKDIEASLQGPAMWGCKMISYEDDPPNFVPGRKYPNGLDCSGFVSWALLNGGFDVGDRGAGESPSPGQLTDLGDFRLLTTSLINSGEIKVGDLFNFWGHIAILIGEDDDNYYIAESLNNYKGLVVKTYSKKSVMKTFKYVVLMDDVYKEDGNLTDMWY